MVQFGSVAGKKNEVVGIAEVVLDAQFPLRELIQPIEVNVGKKL